MFLLAISFVCANAGLTLPGIFSDNMVLQQNSDVAFWGKADPEKKVEITQSWSSEKTVVIADADGNWSARVRTTGAGGPYRIVIRSGKERLDIENTLIGEVWICSGQSNMEMPVAGFGGQPVENSADYISSADPETPIRSCNLQRIPSLKEEHDCPAVWYEHDPEGVANASATAYFFALRLYRALGVPVGIINVSWGGTPIEAWMDKELLEREFTGEFDLGCYESGQLRSYNPHEVAGVLYNGMLHSIIPFTAKGFIWYQGCSNKERFEQYKRLQPAFARMLREQWGDADMPFYFTQIAPYGYGAPEERIAGYMMWAQAQTLSMIPHSGMASTHDAGEIDCIHPADKKTVGDRLGYLALVHDYGIKGIDPDPPLFRNVVFDGDKGRVEFTVGYSGLSPINKALDGFELAGEDHIFHPATARIVNWNMIEVSSPEVSAPVAVRYGMHNWSEPSLFNCSGIPASPFRSDDWK